MEGVQRRQPSAWRAGHLLGGPSPPAGQPGQEVWTIISDDDLSDAAVAADSGGFFVGYDAAPCDVRGLPWQDAGRGLRRAFRHPAL